jgi:hypothetical protein
MALAGHTTLISTVFVSFASSCIHDTAGMVFGIRIGVYGVIYIAYMMSGSRLTDLSLVCSWIEGLVLFSILFILYDISCYAHKGRSSGVLPSEI